MRPRLRHLSAAAISALLALAALPGFAIADAGVAEAVPSLASSAQKPFVVPKPRPTETRGRPTDSPDPNRNAYTGPEAPGSPACDSHFCVHWVGFGLDAPARTDSDGDGVPDFVEQVLRVAEHVHSIENDRLGWREPKSDRGRGGGHGKTDIYLSQIGGDLFGYAAPDPGQTSRRSGRLQRRLAGYLVLDNDYSSGEFPGTDPSDDLEVTLAHEYNHILQFGYDAYQDPWFAEATATWMEDQVYNRINDYLRYVRRWVGRYDTPLTTSSIKVYGSAVWNAWLARRYGLSIVRKAWAGAIHVRPGGFSVNAYEAALRRAGGADFGADFTRFAADAAEWRTGRGFRESALYPDMPRQAGLPLDGARVTRELNHTTFALLNVSAHRGRAVVLQASAPRGTSAGLVLVGRTGRGDDGDVVRRLAYRANGGTMTVRLPDPGRFARVTAVLVNADGRADGYSARALDWRYRTDGVPFRLSGRVVPLN
jgi:hypothetical protein